MPTWRFNLVEMKTLYVLFIIILLFILFYISSLLYNENEHMSFIYIHSILEGKKFYGGK